MKIRIGIPRSLFYYRFIPLWETFFRRLDMEVIISEPTNRRILDDGVKSCVDEACLPIKLFHGHVISLKDKVDCIFVPRFTSISKGEYVCPEFGGLPDMLRHTLKDLPPLIDTEINLRKSGRGAVKAAVEIAALLGRSRIDARWALGEAFEDYFDFRYQTQCGVLPFAEQVVNKGAVRGASGASGDGSTCVPRGSETQGEPSPLAIAVIGHPYNIYDKYISMDLLNKLKKLGVSVRTAEMVDDASIAEVVSKLQKPMFWNYGTKAYGAALHLAAEGKIEGMICVTSFGCGIDSFVHDLVERRIRREYGVPFIIMTIDEHSGEAGFDTRLEAFVDMLRWRRANENNVSASG